MEALWESNLRPHTLKECKPPSKHPLSPHTVSNKKMVEKKKEKVTVSREVEPNFYLPRNSPLVILSLIGIPGEMF